MIPLLPASPLYMVGGKRQPRECNSFRWGAELIHVHRPEHPRTRLLYGWQFSQSGVVIANDIRQVTKAEAVRRFEQLSTQLGGKFIATLAHTKANNMGVVLL